MEIISSKSSSSCPSAESPSSAIEPLLSMLAVMATSRAKVRSVFANGWRCNILFKKRFLLQAGEGRGDLKTKRLRGLAKTLRTSIELENFSIVNLVSMFRCSSSTANPVYTRRVTSLVLVCSLSSHRHSYTSYL